jgi:NAD(P)H-hydrate epimerase
MTQILSAQSAVLPTRLKNSHKGDFGHVLVVGGDHGMLGAVRLCGEAALRSGAGLVSVATRKEHAALLSATCPELMAHGCEDEAYFAKLLEKASVVAIGPGLGRGEWGQTFLKAVCISPKPVIIDADGLNLLAEMTMTCPVICLLTPHPKEAARLLKTTTEKIQSDRILAVLELAKQFKATVVLKGSGSLVASTENSIVSICPFGTPAMATAGMGDVLTGVIAAMLAQKLSPRAAAEAGVVAHALAGERAANGRERGMLASDVLRELSTV